jgi:hypothetical protein
MKPLEPQPSRRRCSRRRRRSRNVDQVDIDVAEVDEEAPRAEHMSTKMWLKKPLMPNHVDDESGGVVAEVVE